MVSDQSIVASTIHDGRVVLDKGKGMSMEVAEHGVTFPSTDDANFVRVDTAKEQGHGTAGAEGASCDIIWVDPRVARDREGGSTQEGRNHSTRDQLCG